MINTVFVRECVQVLGDLEVFPLAFDASFVEDYEVERPDDQNGKIKIHK